MKRFVQRLTIAVLLFSVQDVFASESETKAVDPNYAACTACHGTEAKGNIALKAPGLANLESDYISRQLRNFKKGVRGAHSQDVTGAQMRAFVANMQEDDMDRLATYIAAFKNYEPEPTMSGNPEQGKNFYYHQCGACHGVAAKGNALLKAPKLAGLEDWYLLAQLQKFREGIRGTHEADKLGAQMHYMMSRLKNEAQMVDIISYLRNPIDSE